MNNREKILIYSLIGFCINVSYISGNLFISNFSEVLGASKSFIGLINAILPFFSILSAPIFARKAARLRRKLPIIRSGLLIGAFFSLLLFFSHDKLLIFVFRMGMGVAFGATTGLTNSLATEIDTEKRGRYFGIYSAACSFGWAIGSLLVGIVISETYSNAFLIPVIFLSIGFVATFFAVEKNTSIGYYGIDFQTLKKFLPFYRTMFLRHSVATALWAFLPLYLEFTLGFDRLIIATIYFINNSLQVITMPLSGHLADKIKKTHIVFMGLIGSLIFFFIFTIIKTPIEFMLLQILVALSWALVYIGISSLVTSYSNWNERGEAMSGLSMSLNLSSIVGPLIGGIIYGLSDFVNMIYILLPLCIIAIISSLFLKEK
ncbi:MAG: drug efflux system protein MdtG [Candidatus Methanofastidiosum methylothiophilum]|uniref:Drug efflux system protein MdtG n=1 Tax=Candidatus Methanofastidiosum methylothiophilum TaxID=1705564 RepID=A0A150IX71_9EURY|nr:MAG: drug efflux system protein MdtG [Candidatus Methanofastidiosum methylthiophilus]KYC46799.1 MAG: drug efflux system protein MdtG [Candidatus Methanofastidiosum methylthiophilus]KYC49485.1 MAG: drug efflux system protein MdtG [Candidatus Methanofastidiosum methylthiophilus]